MTKRKKKLPHFGTPKSRKKPPLKARRYFILLTSAVLVTGFLFYLYLHHRVRSVFDGDRAFRYLEAQCEFGPRVPGSEAQRRCGDYLVRELKKYCDSVSEQRFQYRDKKDPTLVYPGRNIIASINLHPKKNFRVLLCAHWDSRPWADKDPDPVNRNTPVAGANDGASGVAVILEMARILRQTRPPFGVDFILFDLEDLGDYHAESYRDSLNDFCIGSEYFIAHDTAYHPRYGILLDMIGDAELTIKKEGFSQARAPLLVNRVWVLAQKIPAPAFVDEQDVAIVDDHVPFLNRGIQVINLIDFQYPYWHTIADTPDKCSPGSLQQVGDVLIELFYNED